MSDHLPTVESTILASDGSFTVTDSKSRKLIYKPLSILERSRVMRFAGNDACKNEYLISMYILSASVRIIDDIPQAFPHDFRTLEGCLSKVGDEGFAAVGEKLAEDANPEADVVADAKNS